MIYLNQQINLNITMSNQTKTKILTYNAVFDPAPEGGYNVSFPNFPGCVTFGKTFEEAKSKAGEVLELWLEELAVEKQNIPAVKTRPIIDEVLVKLPTNAKLVYASHTS